jgi:hypothetical protein
MYIGATALALTLAALLSLGGPAFSASEKASDNSQTKGQKASSPAAVADVATPQRLQQQRLAVHPWLRLTSPA